MQISSNGLWIKRCHCKVFLHWCYCTKAQICDFTSKLSILNANGFRLKNYANFSAVCRLGFSKHHDRRWNDVLEYLGLHTALKLAVIY